MDHDKHIDSPYPLPPPKKSPRILLLVLLVVGLLLTFKGAQSSGSEVKSYFKNALIFQSFAGLTIFVLGAFIGMLFGPLLRHFHALETPQKLILAGVGMVPVFMLYGFSNHFPLRSRLLPLESKQLLVFMLTACFFVWIVWWMGFVEKLTGSDPFQKGLAIAESSDEASEDLFALWSLDERILQIEQGDPLAQTVLPTLSFFSVIWTLWTVGELVALTGPQMDGMLQLGLATLLLAAISWYAISFKHSRQTLKPLRFDFANGKIDSSTPTPLRVDFARIEGFIIERWVQEHDTDTGIGDELIDVDHIRCLLDLGQEKPHITLLSGVIRDDTDEKRVQDFCLQLASRLDLQPETREYSRLSLDDKNRHASS